jgi:hypothetical protein
MPENQEKTRVPEVCQRTRRKPEYQEYAREPGENQSTRSMPENQGNTTVQDFHDTYPQLTTINKVLVQVSTSMKILLDLS